MTEYLASAPVIATRSLEEAREAVTSKILRHRLTAPVDAIDMRLNSVSGRRMTLNYLAYQADIEGSMPPTEDCYVVGMTLAGGLLAASSRGDRVRTAARQAGFACLPVHGHRVHLSPDAEQLVLRIPRASLESHLADALGRPVSGVVDFDLGLDLTTGPGGALLRSVEFLARELDKTDGLAEMPLASDQLEAYVLSALLHAGRHRYSDALAGAEDGHRLGRLAPVVDHIEANADRELTPEILARVACVSVRALQAAFQDRLGESPMAYVRRVRLNRVRAELLDGDPQLVGVTEVATRWGFTHLSRFARQYRDEFDELPSVTLRR